MADDRTATCEAIRREGAIAIIRGFSEEVCLQLARAYIEGGIRLVEVTFDHARADGPARTLATISALRRAFDGQMLVGAGTVLDPAEARAAREAGATFAIAPNTDAEVIATCVSEDLVAIPGAMTPTEIVAAWKAGADFGKVFPATTLGPAYFKAVRAPLPHIPLMAVGGVGPDKVAAYIAAGCAGVGIGGDLTRRDWIEAGAWDRIAEAARAIVAAVREGRAAS